MITRFAAPNSTFVAMLAAASVASTAVAQVQRTPTTTRCDLIARGDSTRLTTENLPNGQSRAFVGGGALVKCPSRSITLQGDSAEIYSDRYYLIGHVVYNEPRLALTSDFLTYFPGDERVVAAGNVDGKLPTGSTFAGPIAEYRRAIVPRRPRAQLNAAARSTVSIVQKDSTGKPMPPMSVSANTMFMDGDSLLYGGGQLTICAPELLAKSDSVFLDTGRETVKLMRNPRIDGRKDKPYTLTGDLIEMFSRNRKLERVFSRGSAVATSQDMKLTADTIYLRVIDDLLERALAWGSKSRAHAVSPTQTMLADSLVVIMPQQRVRNVRAYRRAYAEGKPDTVRFRAEAPDTTDW